MSPALIEESVYVLSAKYGLVAAGEWIEDYDQRMTRERARDLRTEVSGWVSDQLDSGVERLQLVLGKDYLEAVDSRLLLNARVSVVPGPIGRQLHALKCLASNPANAIGLESQGPSFFVPEWEDHVDPAFDFTTDTWSGSSPTERKDKYAHELFTPPPYDGILVSLAQLTKKKGVLRHGASSFRSDRSVKQQLRVPPNMRLMGDCGAFTYLEHENPPFSPEEAASIYGSLGFDIGASVDHIVFPGMTRLDIFGGRTELTRRELHKRVRQTTENARRFIAARETGGWAFEPMGVIQALSPDHFARLFLEYLDMGYRLIALGGLVPKRTDEIIRTLQAIRTVRLSRPDSVGVGIHLFGVIRKELTPERLREFGVTSFDSASYLRKAWLRSDKNYATSDGNWYAAIRIPFANDPRISGGGKIDERKAQEQRCLELLMDYDNGEQTSIDEILPEILAYDRLLSRISDDGSGLEAAYRRTLEDQPWKQCPCAVCRDIGIHALIFRGINRNRRRGFHNMWVLKQSLLTQGDTGSQETFAASEARGR